MARQLMRKLQSLRSPRSFTGSAQDPCSIKRAGKEDSSSFFGISPDLNSSHAFYGTMRCLSPKYVRGISMLHRELLQQLDCKQLFSCAIRHRDTNVRFSSSATGQRLHDGIESFGSNAPFENEPQEIPCGESGEIAGLGASTVQKASEVASVIGDCSYPTAFLQLLIENVHLSSGLPWWASIAATTIGIKVVMLPVLGYQMRASAYLAIMRPELEKINAEVKDSNYDQGVAQDAQKRIKEVFKRHKTNPFAPFIGGIIQAPIFICFFFAVRNMASRVESFKDGGFLWFTDLSTADSTCILPLLTSLSLFAAVELGAAEGMQGNPMADKMKNYMRAFAALAFPLTINLEKALFFYWITTNIWSIFQAAFFRSSVIKRFFGIPSTTHLFEQEVLGAKSAQTLLKAAGSPQKSSPHRSTNSNRRKKPSKGSKRK